MPARLPAFLALTIAAITTLLACSTPEGSGPLLNPAEPAPEMRAVWVTRWDYASEDRVRQLMADAAGLGMTDVIFQVRGQADAFYRSALEPWGEELTDDLPPGATGPAFDPLAVAVKEGHARGLRVHAWVNVMPLWKGKDPPKDKNHPFHTHPEWRLQDTRGRIQDLNDHYVIVNPVLPEVQDHIVAVCADIVRRYDVDGLHLDYVRFVSESLASDATYPGDSRSLAMFKQATGARGVALQRERDMLRDWVRSRITDLVERIKEEAVSEREGVVLTAAVWRRPDLAYAAQLQNAAQWLQSGVLDRAIPMIYSDDDARYEDDLDAWLAAANGRPLTPGIGAYKHQDPDQTRRQMTIARAADASGFCLFAASTLFETDAPDQDRSAEGKRDRRARRDVIRAYLSGR